MKSTAENNKYENRLMPKTYTQHKMRTVMLMTMD